MSRLKSPARASTRRTMTILGLLVGLSGSMCVVASPASAAVPGLVLVSVSSADDSVFDKGAVANCPPGKRVTGAGGDLFGGWGDVVMDNIAVLGPTAAGTRAEEDSSYTGNWQITARAICADPLPGQTYVTSQSASNNANKSVTATCPPGTQLTGVGGDLIGAFGEVVLDDITPNPSLTAVTVWAYAEDPYAASWSVKAFAACANPLPGLELIEASSANDALDSKWATAYCPAGKVLVGTGGDVTGAVGSVVMTITPHPTVPLSVVTVGANETDPYTINWKVRAFGICALP